MSDVEDLEGAMEKMSILAMEIIKQVGELENPYWVMMRPDAPPILFEKSFEDEDMKHIILAAIRGLFRQHSVTQYCVAFENYMTSISLKDQSVLKTIEALSIMGANKDGRKIMWSYQITRMEGGTVMFGERDVMPNMLGNMADLLDD